jgi:hypothetical protein
LPAPTATNVADPGSTDASIAVVNGSSNDDEAVTVSPINGTITFTGVTSTAPARKRSSLWSGWTRKQWIPRRKWFVPPVPAAQAGRKAPTQSPPHLGDRCVRNDDHTHQEVATVGLWSKKGRARDPTLFGVRL